MSNNKIIRQVHSTEKKLFSLHFMIMCIIALNGVWYNLLSSLWLNYFVFVCSFKVLCLYGSGQNSSSNGTLYNQKPLTSLYFGKCMMKKKYKFTLILIKLGMKLVHNWSIWVSKFQISLTMCSKIDFSFSISFPF